ncbi:MAG: ribosome biogenesis GTPase Der [Syntrophaceae bacterium]
MLIAIVGRPTVGKSTLFNLLVRENRAIVGPQRGITRDRIYGRWEIDESISVDVVDTGGYDSLAGGQIELSMRDQTLLAIEEADLIVCLLDARAGVTADDLALVRILRESQADVIYAANKVDDPASNLGTAQLYELGLDGFIEISAVNNRVGGLAEAVRERIANQPTQAVQDSSAIRVSILGRPNVGKSMLLNRITGTERAIVSPIPGTTRDYVDIRITHQEKDYVFIDTAGVRRRSHIDDRLEKVSVMRSIHNVEHAQVSLCVMDATEPLTDQDRNLLGIILDRGRACAIVMNKSDLVDAKQKADIRDKMKLVLRYVPDIPILFTSALTGKQVVKIFALIDTLYAKTTTEVQTAVLNKVLQEATNKMHPPSIKGRRVKLFYINQTGTAPPHFRIVSNHPDFVSESYTRYLSAAIKKGCGLEGIPIKIHFVGK